MTQLFLSATNLQHLPEQELRATGTPACPYRHARGIPSAGTPLTAS